MYINGYILENYSARLLDRDISPSDMEIYSFWPENSLRPFTSTKVKVKGKPLAIEIEFKGTPDEIQVNKSRLLKEMAVSTIRFEALTHHFTGSITSAVLASKVKGYEVIKVGMEVVEHEPAITADISNALSATIHATGNGATPAALIITPSLNLASVAIEGLGEDMVINDLTAGSVITISGEDGTVLENGLNKYPDYISWSFPRLEPGDNEITVSDATLGIQVVYKPRWQ